MVQEHARLTTRRGTLKAPRHVWLPAQVATVFEFLLLGLDALHYKERRDYEVLKHKTDAGVDVPARVDVYSSTTESSRAVTTRQVVQYVSPGDVGRLAHAELLIIDEAAALPLPTVKKLLGPYVVFLASTVTGYEGTGRALQLKLLAQLRQQHARRAVTEAAATAASEVSGDARQKKGAQRLHEQRWAVAADAAKAALGGGGGGGASSSTPTLRELTLEAPVRYAAGDAVEAWLHKALCLESPTRGSHALKEGLPAPADCALRVRRAGRRRIATRTVRGAESRRRRGCWSRVTATPRP